MKPSKTQFFFAKSWPWNLAFWGCPFSIGLPLAMHLYNTREGFVAAILTGTLVGFTTSFFVFYGLRHLRAKINGAPFRKGDVVQILVGQYRGQVACIYEEWRDRKQVRVDLGEQAGKEVEDVFSYIEVCRQSRAAASPNSYPDESSKILDD